MAGPAARRGARHWISCWRDSRRGPWSRPATVEERPRWHPFLRHLEARREQTARALNAALRSDRYRGLMTCLERAAERPALADAASEPCCSALPAVAASAWRRLKKLGRGLESSDPDADFHELRKRAKRVRYTAELIAPIMGRRAARAAAGFIRLLTQIQDTLGEHQDAVVAAGEIELVLAENDHDPAFVRAAKSLLASEHDKADRRAGIVFQGLG